MSSHELVCDQAIFTSIRSPMGEGYRIIATSRGVKAEEKQVITRNSPSHEALSARAFRRSSADSHPAEASNPVLQAVSFYSLPTGRLCVACSCFAGAEHTGRGGQRVYTACVLFDPKGFERCGFNAMNVARAMVAEGMLKPKLKPAEALPEVRLVMGAIWPKASADSVVEIDAGSTPVLAAAKRLLLNAGVLVNTSAEALTTTEWVLAAIPGPLRSSVSFSAGMKYSTSRTHRLYVLTEEKSASREKSRPKGIHYLEDGESQSNGAQVSFAEPSAPAWFDMVERSQRRGRLSELLVRTSRPFVNCSIAGLQRIGHLYGEIDALPNRSWSEIVAGCESEIRRSPGDATCEIEVELFSARRQALFDCAARLEMDEIAALANRLFGFLVHGNEGALLAASVLVECIRRTTIWDIPAAIEMLLSLRGARTPEDSWDSITLGREVGEVFCAYLEHEVAKKANEFSGVDPNGRNQSSQTVPRTPVQLQELALRLRRGFPEEPSAERAVALCRSLLPTTAAAVAD